MEHEPVEEHEEAWLVFDCSEEIDDGAGEEIEGDNLVVETSLETAVVRELGSGSCEETSFLPPRQREYGSNTNEKQN